MTSGVDGAGKTSGLASCLPLLEPLFRAGIPVWLVGGAVRDGLEERIPKDFDFFVPVSTEALWRLLPAAVSVGGRIPTLVLSRGKGVPPLQLSGGEEGLVSDLSRRDFSINAMARRVVPGGLEGEIVDPFGGQEDLKKQWLRVPQPLRNPFREDPVRVLRLMRFVATRGYAVEPGTLDLARGAVGDLGFVAGERRLRELTLFWEGDWLNEVDSRVPADFCGGVLAAGIFGTHCPSLPESGGTEVFVRAVKAAGVSGRVKMWIFVWGVAGPEGGGEMRWGRSLWGRKMAGSDLPLSRGDRHTLVTLDRLRSLFMQWPAAGPPDRRSLSLREADPSQGEVAHLVARDIPEKEKSQFWSWVRQGENVVMTARRQRRVSCPR